MSSKEKAKDNLSHISLRAVKNAHSSGKSANGSGQTLARLVEDQTKTEYLVRQTRVTVGRSSARSAADVDLGESNFISRNHLEIYLDNGRFFVLVTGKNGIFVDDLFHKKGSPPVELPPVCELRFPSTETRLKFESLMNQTTFDTGGEAECHEAVDDEYDNIIELPPESVGQPSSSSVISADEDTNSDVNPYAEDTASDSGDQSASAADVVPISLETEEVWAPTTVSRKLQVSQVHLPSAAPVLNIRHAAAVRSGSSTSAAPVSISPATGSTVRGPVDESKPPFSYAQLIVQAIMSTPDKQLTLSGIYTYISHHYPYYKPNDKGWQNSIRHNLSLNRYFIKVARGQEESGKGSFWKVDPSSESMLVDQAFRRRRQRGPSGTPQYIRSAVQVSSSGLHTPDTSMTWDDQAAVDSITEAQPTTVYIAEQKPDLASRIAVQRVQDMNWATSTFAGHQRIVRVDPSAAAMSLVEEAQCTEEGVSVYNSYESEAAVTEAPTPPVLAKAQTSTALPQITILRAGSSQASNLSTASPQAAVVRYITTYSQGTPVRQAVLIPIMPVTQSESASVTTGANGETKAVAIKPSVVTVLNSTSTGVVSNGQTTPHRQQLVVGSTGVQPRNGVAAGSVPTRLPSVNAVLSIRKRPVILTTGSDDGAPPAKSDCLDSSPTAI